MEEFVKQSPFFFTYGVFGFALYGLLRTNWTTARLRWFGWISLYLILTLLILQSVFQSFQERYLFPLLPLVCLFAGHGFATLERHTDQHRRRFWLIAAPALLYSIVLSSLVGWWQASPFLDVKHAAQSIRHKFQQQRILTNERYAKMVGPKTRFWSGHENVYALLENPPQPGDVILLSSYDMGSPEPYREIREQLLRQFRARIVNSYSHSSMPIFPDIMENGMYAQNPQALVFRYRPQFFETIILEIPPVKMSVIPEETPPPLTTPQNPEIEKLQKELQDLSRDMQELRDGRDKK